MRYHKNGHCLASPNVAPPSSWFRLPLLWRAAVWLDHALLDTGSPACIALFHVAAALCVGYFYFFLHSLP